MTVPVATRYSYEFIRKHLPADGADVLEVGCGRGELAGRLSRDGHRVVAIDPDPDCVAMTSSLGVDARQASWPVDLGGRFDAVLFTRSLHHIHPLGGSVAAARDALRPGGVVIVEDFRSEGAGDASSSWYRGLTRTLHAAGSFVDGFDLEERLSADDTHGHHLHSSSAIDVALRDFFDDIRREDAAYYFRYLEPAFRQPFAVEAALSFELAMIECGAIAALGRRFVARSV